MKKILFLGLLGAATLSGFASSVMGMQSLNSSLENANKDHQKVNWYTISSLADLEKFKKENETGSHQPSICLWYDENFDENFIELTQETLLYLTSLKNVRLKFKLPSLKETSDKDLKTLLFSLADMDVQSLSLELSDFGGDDETGQKIVQALPKIPKLRALEFDIDSEIPLLPLLKKFPNLEKAQVPFGSLEEVQNLPSSFTVSNFSGHQTPLDQMIEAEVSRLFFRS